MHEVWGTSVWEEVVVLNIIVVVAVLIVEHCSALQTSYHVRNLVSYGFIFSA